ncbi:MAG: rod shape-determining protein [Lachnospiraceae bacterium]|nr:rod shape-determining protein [Lachnospiraceae bacterium]
MANVNRGSDNLVFGLDIGTRSIVGTVGYLLKDKFHVVGQCIKEHETRAMLDGQIHDIMKVGGTIKAVKETLEKQLSVKLSDVCIAAAGRVLRTITTTAELSFEAEKEVNAEDIYNLLMEGVEQAYADFAKVNDSGLKFYCVGYTPMRYYMNGYQIGNLEGHKASKISCDLIATFLPDDVVDGLYKAVELAGLQVSNMTLEPIAAIQVAIPEKFRMLNLALVDVGAGTSDISITSDGTIVAYGMIPTAGDSLTEIIVQNCLVEFETAEMIKRAADGDEMIEYSDILGLPQTIEPGKVLEMLDAKLEEMTDMVAAEIKRLNGDKSVSAVFVVGGGGTVPGYTEKLAAKLGIVKERVAIRGKEVMQSIEFENEDAHRDSLMVTPIGICLSYYEQSNNFIFVQFNGQRLKLYDNGKLTVSDAAMQVSLPNEDLFPKRGKALTFTVNGKSRMVRGEQGEPCVIKLNKEPADLYTSIGSGDNIEVIPSTAGEDAKASLGSLKEMSEPLHIVVNGKTVSLPRTAVVGDEIKNEFYEITDGDDITIDNFYTVSQIMKLLEISVSSDILVNGTPANDNTKVYEDFTVDFNVEDIINGISRESEESEESEESGEESKENRTFDDSYKTDSNKKTKQDSSEKSTKQGSADKSSKQEASDKSSKQDDAENGEDKTEEKSGPHDINIIANGDPITMKGKSNYVFVDVFDYIDFDLRNPAGRSVITKVNGLEAAYMQELHDGDTLEIYWEKR